MKGLQSHPSRSDLVRHAESMLGQGRRISAMVAGHVATCEHCQVEVDAIQSTLTVAETPDALEPSREFHARLLLAARQERAAVQQSNVTMFMRRARLRKVSYTACVLIVMGIAYGFVEYTRTISSDPGVLTDSQGVMDASVLSLDTLREASAVEILLSNVVMAEDRLPQSSWEAERRRAVMTWNDEIDDALEAFENNPACVRAKVMVNRNREYLGETLKTIYVERSH